MTETNIFYERLSQLNQLHGKSFNQVERELGLPRNSLNNYRYGKTPSAKRLLELAHYYDVLPNYLMGETNMMNDEAKMKEFYQSLSYHQRMEMLKLCQDWFMTQTNSRTAKAYTL